MIHYSCSYYVEFIDECGVKKINSDYNIIFKELDTFKMSEQELIIEGKRAFATRHPQCEIISIKPLSKGVFNF